MIRELFRGQLTKYFKDKFAGIGETEFDALSGDEKRMLITGTEDKAFQLLTNLQNNGRFPRSDAATEIICNYREYYRQNPGLFPTDEIHTR